jgi:hypothetical protein
MKRTAFTFFSAKRSISTSGMPFASAACGEKKLSVEGDELQALDATLALLDARKPVCRLSHDLTVIFLAEATPLVIASLLVALGTQACLCVSRGCDKEGP